MTADAEGVARSGSAPITLAAMTLSASMILVDQTAVPLATADAIADLGGAVSEGQWILTANILPLAALMVLGGRLGDLLGLRRVFLVCFVLVRRESLLRRPGVWPALALDLHHRRDHAGYHPPPAWR